MPDNRYPSITRRRTLSLLGGVASIVCSAPARAADDTVWTALRQGSAFAIIRHALAPGTGDPANFNLEDCSTQRNLSGAGRRQAVRLGTVMRDNAIADADVFSSAWCRCHETAVLMNFGPPTILPALNSFFQTMQRETEQTQALTTFVAARRSDRPLVLVTHQVNITALTDVFPQSGEIIFVTRRNDGSARVLGRLATET